MKQRFINYIYSIAAIDYRSINFFRFLTGVILVLETITKSANLFDFYVDEGAIPRALAMGGQGNWEFSLHFFNGEWPFQAFLFLLQGIFALCVLFNYRAKLFLFLSWFIIISLQTRADIILNAGDCLFRQLLFWSLFLPLDRKIDVKKSYLGIGSAAALLQMLLMYFATGLLKDHPIWTKDFTAIQYALNLDQFATPLGHYLLQFPSLLHALTWETIHLEIYGPVLLILPLFWWLRLPLVLSFMGLHFGLILTMELGLFPYVCILGWTLFLPSGFWDFIESKTELTKKISAYYTSITSIAHRKLPKVPPSAPVPNWLSYARNALAAYALIIMIVWNLSYLVKKGFAVPQPLRASGLFLRLDQKWNMFAPFPMKVDGWFVVPGKLRDGTEVDAYTWQPVTWERPKSLWNHYINTQWRKYLTNIWESGHNEDQLQFGKYLCRRWNDPAKHPTEKQLLTYEIYFMKTVINLNGEPSKPEKILYWQHSCFGK